MSDKPTYEELEKQVQDLEQKVAKNRRLEKELYTSQNITEGILNAVPVRIFWKDKNLIYMGCNELFAHDAGLHDPKDIVGKDDYQLRWRDQAELYRSDDREIIQSGKPRFLIEEPQTTPTGKSITFLTSKIPLKSSTGEIRGVLGTYMDITEHKRAEELTRASEVKFKELFNKAAIPLCLINKNTSKLEFNEKFGTTFGYTVEDIPTIDKWWHLAYPDPVYQKEALEICEAVLNRAIKRDTDLEPTEYHVTCKNGDVLDMVVLGSSIDNDWLLTFYDITARKQAEKALRKSEEKYRSFFENSCDSMLLHQEDLFIDCNTAAARALGYEKTQDILNVHPSEISPEYQPDGKKSYDKAMEMIEIAYTRGTHRFEWEHINTKGNPFPVEVSLTAISFEDEKRLLSVWRDISARKQAEEKLHRSEEKYRTILESFVDPLVICSPDFSVEYMNPAMIRRTGRDRTGEKCFSAIHGLKSTCGWCVFDKIVSGDIIEADIKSPLDDRNYHITQMPIQNQDGTTSMMSLYRDITDYLEAVSEKEQTKAQLFQSQKMESIGNLAGGIAHDFNNILSSILGFTELALAAAPENSEQRDDLEEVVTAGNRAKELVQQILAFARQSEEKTKPVRLSDIVTETLKLLRPSTPTNIDIKPTINSTKKIMGNASQLHQIIMNLCTNAIHSLQDTGGVLEISLQNTNLAKEQVTNTTTLPGGEYVELAITDNGAGIDPAIIERIFEPYFTTKAVGEGTGMGLAVVKGIVHSYGGDIRINSEPGEKTSFILRLPTTGGRREEERPPSDSAPPGTERVLFVDDEPPIAQMGSRMLERLGYKVTFRTSSFEALELFRQNPDAFDLVITDMTMPSMTGDELSRKMRSIRQNIPIILCTGYSNKLNDIKSQQIGINAIVYKPFTKPDLAKTIREVLTTNRTPAGL